MADLNPMKLSDMTDAGTLDANALMYATIPDAGSDTGYYSRKILASAAAQSILNTFSFPLLITKTTAKNVIGAINEVAAVYVSGTLTAGSTSITLSDAAITATSKLRFYSDVWGLYPNAAPVVSTGSVTLTFDAQQADASIIVEVKE